MTAAAPSLDDRTFLRANPDIVGGAPAGRTTAGGTTAGRTTVGRAPARPTDTSTSPWALRPADGRPVAAVRLPGGGLDEIRDGLREAGFSVLDILAQDSGPAPLVLVLELPGDVEGDARILGAGANGPGRVLVSADRARLASAGLRPGLDEVVDAGCHPLQVAAAALRVSGAPEWQLARWSETAFAELPHR